MQKREILKVVVGSQAHGLARPDSDFDYRAVYIVPTSEILSLGAKPEATTWIEGKEDNTAYELGHFPHLAMKCNPSILEVFVAPYARPGPEGLDAKTAEALRALFPHVWNSVDVRNAFLGYGHNQRKKFMEEKDGRPWKYAVAYLRVLQMGIDLLTSGFMTLAVRDVWKQPLLDVRDGKWSKGLVIDTAEQLARDLDAAFAANKNKAANVKTVNDYLLMMRRQCWEAE